MDEPFGSWCTRSVGADERRVSTTSRFKRKEEVERTRTCSLIFLASPSSSPAPSCVGTVVCAFLRFLPIALLSARWWPSSPCWWWWW